MKTKKKILLAEDDELLASLLKYRIQMAGFEIIMAKDGREVKKHLEIHTPDIIISDIMMPYFSGIELLDYLRNEMHSKIPVIIISTAGNEENVLNAFELGADDFIAKPVSPSELLVRIQRALPN